MTQGTDDSVLEVVQITLKPFVIFALLHNIGGAGPW